MRRCWKRKRLIREEMERVEHANVGANTKVQKVFGIPGQHAPELRDYDRRIDTPSRTYL